ncbi:MAG: hypothetical protein P8L66_04795 [Rhodospirillaceae bacterium]|nr:hypothetical protein [Rhodospirillaceae bacterium]
MTLKIKTIAATIFLWAQSVSAETPTLSEEGTFLGRFSGQDVNIPLRITVGIQNDIPIATYVMARFQNNAPMQRLAGEGWVDWSENQSDLVDNAIQPSADKTLTFDLIEQGLSFVFLPVMVTFAYTVEDGSLKSGYMVID